MACVKSALHAIILKLITYDIKTWISISMNLFMLV